MIKPRLVLDVLQLQPPKAVAPKQPIGEALELMRVHDFSQVPVYDAKEFVGLLTTNTIARWLAAQLKEHDGLAESEPVAAVMAHREDSEETMHLPRVATVNEVVARFVSAASEGRQLQAIVLTQAGKEQGESPLGLVVAADLARLSE